MLSFLGLRHGFIACTTSVQRWFRGFFWKAARIASRLKFMGAVLSLAAPRSSINDCNEVLQSGTWKKNKSSCLNKDNSRLIPCLPDELSLQILARIPRIHYFNLSLQNLQNH
ncbi:hypothetical protein ERO13_A05G284200v2 [Gossypium hirsutum]|uniref:F-box/kelch-repeat protein At1g22040 isoform X5 n=3 Tax=Gossypium TaxID=3633 RepID=A0ABM3BME6_GOSHI|nr:F-box/kelch-repeat protein At1g22040-like isoform X5 [Gossypium hirsutum]KAG4201533.1 hypothetical protein ERO13_A05G284200v2 [Gossypium hirsutum]TYJ36410.1 hypothetical protein E1A91_A05G305100v1 [Gossypium mustelinum]